MSDLLPPGTWSVASRQWQGARAYQEDDFEIVEEAFGARSATAAVLLVLADGMGGEAGGARASRSVVEAFAHRFGRLPGTTPTRLNACLGIASDALEAQVQAEPELEGMGSTAVAALYDGRSLTWLSVGDSPMWILSDGRLKRLNADHSMAPVLDRMAETGELSPREALTDARRHMLRSAVTGEEVELIDCAQRSCRLERGEYLVLASDGLETLAVHHIERLLGESDGNADQAAEALISAVRAADRPHQDNVTLLVMARQEAGAGGRVLPSPQSDDTIVTRAPGRTSSTGSRQVVSASLLGAGLVVAVGLIWWQILEDLGTAPEAAHEQGQPAAQPSPAEQPAAQAPGPAAPDTADEASSTQGQPAGDSTTAVPEPDEAPPPAGSESPQAADPEPAGADSEGSAPTAPAVPDDGEGGATTQERPAGKSPPAAPPKEVEQQGADDPDPRTPHPRAPETRRRSLRVARTRNPPARRRRMPPRSLHPRRTRPPTNRRLRRSRRRTSRKGRTTPHPRTPELRRRSPRITETRNSPSRRGLELPRTPHPRKASPPANRRLRCSRRKRSRKEWTTPRPRVPATRRLAPRMLATCHWRRPSHRASESDRPIGSIDRGGTACAQNRSCPRRARW